ncbi:hypothetical protein Pan110_25040 [Gimesia panareensis]|nr:hypothetical protein Pan110_25040 [Gimesia panareensis]
MLYIILLWLLGMYLMLGACLEWNSIMAGPTASILILLYGRMTTRMAYFASGLFWFAVGWLPVLDLYFNGIGHI